LIIGIEANYGSGDTCIAEILVSVQPFKQSKNIEKLDKIFKFAADKSCESLSNKPKSLHCTKNTPARHKEEAGQEKLTT